MTCPWPHGRKEQGQVSERRQPGCLTNLFWKDCLWLWCHLGATLPLPSCPALPAPGGAGSEGAGAEEGLDAWWRDGGSPCRDPSLLMTLKHLCPSAHSSRALAVQGGGHRLSAPAGVRSGTLMREASEPGQSAQRHITSL